MEHAADGKSLEWLEQLRAAHPPGTLLGDVMAAGGLKRQIRDLGLDPGVAAALDEALAQQLAPLSASQGLRFRSSSTAEDVQGFNGAGLYDSNTGFGQPPAEAAGRTYGWALLKTWASYWSFEAFEERRRAGIDHLDGRMGVLVHPRFDDPLEDGNAVVTTFVMRTDAGLHQTMIVNAQPGAHSVTNPGSGEVAQAELDRLEGLVGGAVTIERSQLSELAGGAEVFSEAELLLIFEQVGALADAWLARASEGLPPAWRPGTIVLDLELKRMKPGWPAGAADALDGGVVYKQVRPLDRPIVRLAELLGSPTPRDVLTRVASALRRRCSDVGLELESLEIRTDPSLPWGALNAVRPFTPTLTVRSALLGEVTLDHTQCDALHHPGTTAEAWDLEVLPHGATPFSSLRVEVDGSWVLQGPGGQASGVALSCTTEPLLVTGAQYLSELFGP